MKSSEVSSYKTSIAKLVCLKAVHNLRHNGFSDALPTLIVSRNLWTAPKLEQCLNLSG